MEVFRQGDFLETEFPPDQIQFHVFLVSDELLFMKAAPIYASFPTLLFIKLCQSERHKLMLGFNVV